MDYFLAVLFLVIGIALVIKGGDWFVDSASWIAKAARIPSFIIGATIVSIATTMPELIVSIISAFDGLNDMAIGNAVGSVTANTGMIMALSFIFLGAVIDRKKQLPQILMLVGSSLFLFLGSLTGALSVWASVVLIVIFCCFMTLNVLAAMKEGKKEALLDGNDIKNDAEGGKDGVSGVQEGAAEKPKGKEIAKNVILFIVGAGCIFGGSQLLVKGGSDLATLLGIPDRIIAITLVAIGTSLPELITTITAIRKKESHLSIGNVIGANIIDLTLILPICSLISGQPLPVSPMCLYVDMTVCLGIIAFAVLPLFIKGKSFKAQGALLLAAYIAYLTVSALL